MRPGVATLLSLALLSTSCRPAPQREPLRIGLNVWPGYEFVHLAHRLGIYERAGLDVDVLEFGSLSDVRRAFERGQLDGFGGTLAEVIIADQQSNREPRIVYATDYSAGGDVIQARDPIRTAADLKGARVGLDIATLNSFVLARCLDRHGLRFDDVTLVQVDHESMFPAMRDRTVDAVVTFPPVSLQVASLEGVTTVFSSVDIPGEVVDVLCVDQRVLDERPDDVARLTRAFDRAVAAYRADPAATVPLMAGRHGITDQEFVDVLENEIVVLDLKRQPEMFGESGPLRHALSRMHDVLVDTGVIEPSLDGVLRLLGPCPQGVIRAGP